MTEDDPLRTQRDVVTPVTLELSAAGFEDAEEIGRGGFGVVYRCTEVALDRTVAVKVLSAELDEDNHARFLREQRAMGRLTGHPNIVTVLEAGITASGRPFLVMPFHPLKSLDSGIRQQGPLPLEHVLWIGVKIAGALESAHRLGVVHRDVKPGNILLTDYGEPALTDFGIARITGEFQTAAGILTGSPAFTAPEVLEGNAPGPAADVYGLGATLFCALTGHAAFERHSGENVVTQFLRMTSQAVPDLSEVGIAEDVAAVVASAMGRDPSERPSAEVLGETMRQVQRRHGFRIDEMALQAEPVYDHSDRGASSRGWHPPAAAAGARGSGGGLPLELTSFVGRRTEVLEVKNLLPSARLVTVTGIGGVGKTRLALRAASTVRRDVADEVRFVELADVSDPSLLVEVLAATLGLRDESVRPLLDVLVEFLSSRKSLLVLDNCEQVVAGVAGLVETLLRDCPDLRILVTSREPLNVAGEAVLRVSPLTVPDPDRESSLQGLPRYDAVTLFADRAAAAAPGFELSDDNKATVARICARLDGLPLGIELAAARMRAMSLEQILQRLDDRYALLTRNSRTAPTRQQTLRWCIDWSYELCTEAEMRLWSRLSVFAGTFELDAAEQVCGADLEPHSPLDVLSSLVDKSILIREASGGTVRFRMLETLRDYGREKLRASDEYSGLRRRHREWYQQLALEAETEWISERQPYWIARLEREQPNFREALEYCLTENTQEAAESGLQTVGALFIFWSFRGVYGEGRRWIDRIVNHPAHQSIPDRVKALYAGCILAAVQGDLPSATALLDKARLLAEQDPTPATQALIAYADGSIGLYRGELARASTSFERALALFGTASGGYLYVAALTLLGWTHELEGDTTRAIEYHEQALAVTEARGESLYRSTALWGIGVALWQQGDRQRAIEMLKNALRVNREVRSPTIGGLCLEALAWTVGAGGDAERAAVLMGASAEVLQSVGSAGFVFPALPGYHRDCEQTTRSALGTRKFDADFHRGRDMGLDAAVAYALEESTTPASTTALPANLTKREWQVAGLVAQGLTNKQIAAKLVIAQRTAQGHVEHILTKLGYTSRSQVAAWIMDETKHGVH